MPPKTHSDKPIFAKCPLCANNPNDNIKQRFLSAISHEFKTPLTHLLGFNDILLTKKHNRKEQALLNQIQHEAEKLLQLVNEALSAAEQSTPSAKPEQQPEKSPPLKNNLTLKPTPLPDRSQQLRLILENLLDNEQEPTEATPRLLIVDDMKEMRLLLKFYLQECDYLLEFAHNGQQAVEMHQQNPYHIIIMDMRMPIMDGLEATQKIRLWEKEQQQASTIIGLTADHGHQQHYLSQGCNELLTKPVQRQTLLDLIVTSLANTDKKS